MNKIIYWSIVISLSLFAALIIFIVGTVFFLHMTPVSEPNVNYYQQVENKNTNTLPRVDNKPEPVHEEEEQIIVEQKADVTVEVEPVAVEKVQEPEPESKVIVTEELEREPVIQNAFEKAVNSERVKRGLTKLPVCTCLREAAETRATEINTTRVISHLRPNGDMFSVGLFCEFGVRGENLAFKVPMDTVVSRWIESPSHNDVMFRKYWKWFAVSVVGDTVAMEFGA